MSVDAPEVLEIRPGMAVLLTMDFADDFSAGETITGTPTVALDTEGGVTVSSISSSGSVVKALFTATAGATLGRRVVTYTPTTSLSQVLPRCGLLAVVKSE